MFPSIYSHIHNVLPSHADQSVVVYTSMDHVTFAAHPSPIYGSRPICDLSSVLQEIHTKLAIQVVNLYTRRAIDSAPCPQGDVDIDPGFSVRVVDDAHDIIQLPPYEPVFIRKDGSLVIWGDSEDALLSFWFDIIFRLQIQSASAIPTTTPVAGLPGNGGILWGNGPLPYLDEFFDLLTLPDYPPSWGTDLQGYEASAFSDYASWQRVTSAGPPEGSLGLAFAQRAPSPFSDATTTASSVLNSPYTADLGGIFPSYTPSVYVGEEDDFGSLGFALSIGDRDISPSLSSSHWTTGIMVPNSSTTTTITPVPEQEASSGGSSSRHRHPVAETQTQTQTQTVTSSAPAGPESSFAHAIVQKVVMREHEEAGYHFPQPIIINVKSSASDDAAVTGNADVDLRNAANTRVLKRRLSVIATGSAPARLSTPLPDVQDEKRRKLLPIAPAPLPASSSTTSSTRTSTPTSTPAPAFTPTPTPTSAPPSTAPGKPQRRPGNGRRGGGARTSKNLRGKRYPCDYCPKTFSRMQDQHRHTTTSCNASPNRSTVDCPECGAILSRLDAAQRHWRGHENPSCETPDWVSGR